MSDIVFTEPPNFQFRPKFRWRIYHPERLVRSVRLTNLSHLVYQGLVIAWLGPLNWATIIVPAMVAAAGIGSLLFWVQHNFEQTYQVDDDAWRFVAMGLAGSSYLRLPKLLDWCSGSIGIHHAHHLNARIPNYRLEAARSAIPALAAVKPLTHDDLAKCFSHVYWDPHRGRMISYDELFAATGL